MAILKYAYLTFGVVFYVILNVFSYTHPQFVGAMTIKVFYSVISCLLLIMDYILILKTEWILKKPFKHLTTYTKIMLYLGILIIPLISLYYES